MKKNSAYIILIIAVLFTTNLYAQLGNIIPGGPDGRLPYEDDGITLSWTLAGYKGEIPYAEETIDVTDYGAVGDGLTDDTDAIMDAIDYANNYILSEIYFPPGIYLIKSEDPLLNNSALDITKNNIILKGDLADITELKFDIGDNVESHCIRISGRNNVGIEDLKITRADSSYEVGGTTILFSNSNNCWVMGVESSRAFSSSISIQGCNHIEVTGCYLHNPQNVCGGGFGYGVVVSNSNYCLVENNIFSKFRHSMILAAHSFNNVFGYNYSREPRQTDHPILGEDFIADICLHGNSSNPNSSELKPEYNLFEGNIVAQIKVDRFWGRNGPYNTFFRNKGGKYGIWIQRGNTNQTIVNNYAKCLNWFYSYWYHMPRRFSTLTYFEKNTLVKKVNYWGVPYEEVWSDGVNNLEYPSAWDEPNLSYYYSDEPDFISDISEWPFHPKNNPSNPAKMHWDYGLIKTVSRDNPQGEIVTINWENNITLSTDLIIPSGVRIVISPGVKVYFDHNIKLIIKGSITAEGTDHYTGEILFTEKDAGEGWGGIFFDRFPNMDPELGSSIFEYCKFEYAYYFTPQPREGREDDGGSAISATYCSDIIIDNCLFENNTSWGGGGAIYLNHSDITIKNSIFRNNTSLWVGGAIGSLCSSPEIINNIITNNTAGYDCQYGDGEGGGLYFQYSNEREIRLIGNVICNNFVDGFGGGLSIVAIDEWTGYKLIALNNTISNNNATWWGGAVYTWYSDDKFINNIFWGNTADYGTQFFIYHPGYSYIDFYHCDIEGGIDGGIEVYGTLLGEDVNNINVDPMFVDSTNGDFRLENWSECINAGLNPDGVNLLYCLPATDPAGNPRIAAEIIDIGAYEYFDPGIYVEIVELGFGVLTNRETSQDTIVVKNNGTNDVTLYPDSFIIPEGFEVICESTVISPDDSTNILVDFIPDKMFLDYIDTLIIYSSDPFFPELQFLLTGTTIPPEYQEISGEITNDETWSGYILITGDVNVTNGATLTIAENAEVYLIDGYELVLESGHLIMNGAKMFLRNNSKIDIYDIMTLSGCSLVEVTTGSVFELKPGSVLYGTEHTIWVDTNTGKSYNSWLEMDADVPNHNGNIVTIPGDRIITNNGGRIIANGDPTDRITITSIGDGYYWDGIEINNGWISHIHGCDISKISYIKLNNSEFDLHNSTFSDCNQIIARNESEIYLYGNIFEDNGACPIVFYESDGHIFDNNIINNEGNGISIYYPSLYGSFLIIHNTIQYNNGRGVDLYNVPVMFTDNEIRYNGNPDNPNSARSIGFFASGNSGGANMGGNTIENNYGVEILATRDAFPNLTYSLNTIYDEYDPDGYIYLDQFLLACGGYDGNPIDVRGNDFPNDSDPDFEDRFLPFYDAYIFDGEKPPEKILYEEGIVEIADSLYESAKTTMTSIVDDYPETKTAVSALQWLMYLEKFIGHDYSGLRDYIETIDEISYPNLERVKYNTTTSSYMAEADYETVINRLEVILADPPSEPDSIFAYIDEGYCYLKLDEQGGKAAVEECTFKPRCFEEFRYVSQNMTTNLLDKAILHPEPSPEIETFTLYQNYPNPICNSTTISFIPAPEIEKSEIRIYNIKGQLVKKLEVRSKRLGVEKVIWNGKDGNGKRLANGIYFYKVISGDKSIVKKMLLLR